MSGDGATPAGPLAGLRVIELDGEYGYASFAGKLMADMGADVILVEPPGPDGTEQVLRPPAGEPVPQSVLWRWHYNTSKRSVALGGTLKERCPLLLRLIQSADILLESETPQNIRDVGLEYADLQPLNPRLIMASLTPYGRADPRSNGRWPDLTILADGGPVWSCGYDDHALPPVRGGGNQGYHTGCHFAVMSTLVALLHRQRSGRGQHIDVNMHAAANVTTEAGTYTWLVARETVQRQTGRHAAVRPTMPTQIRCADGRYCMTGIPPRTPAQFRSVVAWLQTLGLAEEFHQTAVLELAAEGPPLQLSRIAEDEETRAKITAGREAMNFLAERLPAYDYFVGSQARGFQVGIVYAPEEAFEDPHFKARGFQVEVEHPELGRSFRYPGAPIYFTKTPWRIRRRAPLPGEDNAEIFAELGLNEERLAALCAEGVL